MNNNNRSKLNWRKALSTLAIGLGTVISLDIPAIAAPVEDNFRLAQVGVRSRITSPTPLNLRPRTHTPLPSSNYSHYPNHSYGKHHRYHRRHDHHNHGHHGHTHRNRHRKGGRVIIISPGSHRSYSNYGNYSNSGSYIRVIGK